MEHVERMERMKRMTRAQRNVCNGSGRGATQRDDGVPEQETVTYVTYVTYRTRRRGP